jgi:UDP-GlcNAc:undecaprenyl-phosphate/decaprenyl-phosphate GlcNAc-1-phosphate transferase
MRLGHGHRRSVLILWAWTAVLSGVVLVPVYTQSGFTVFPIAVLGLGLLLYTVLHPSLRTHRIGDGNGSHAVGAEPVDASAQAPADASAAPVATSAPGH